MMTCQKYFRCAPFGSSSRKDLDWIRSENGDPYTGDTFVHDVWKFLYQQYNLDMRMAAVAAAPLVDLKIKNEL